MTSSYSAPLSAFNVGSNIVMLSSLPLSSQPCCRGKRPIGFVREDVWWKTGARVPETETVFGGSGSEEVVDLLVDIAGALELVDTSNLSLSQVVAVDGCEGAI
jgi:hypothetical protein